MNTESGRSMVEMLGVLAIIGVLSIGGIAGYTLAMRRYKANEVLNALSMASIYGMTANGGSGLSSGAISAEKVGLASWPTALSAVSATSATPTKGEVSFTISDGDVGKLVAEIGGTTHIGGSCTSSSCTSGTYFQSSLS